MTVKMVLVLILNLWKNSWILEVFNAFSYRISGLILLSWKQKHHLGSKRTLTFSASAFINSYVFADICTTSRLSAAYPSPHEDCIDLKQEAIFL